jgi:Big-like domain-containing protein
MRAGAPRQLVLVAVTAGLLALPAGGGLAASPPFRTADFTVDPHWVGIDNRPTTGSPACSSRHFDFGWSDTANAGGPAGEIGGSLERSSRYRAYYAVKLPRSASLDDPLAAAGRLTVDGPSGGALMFGWFNSSSSVDFRAPDSFGLRLAASSAGWRALVDLGTTDNLATGIGDPSLTFGYDQVYDWSLTYDPRGGAQRVGLINLKVGGRTATRSLTPALRADGATFDHFGFMDVMIDGSSLKAYVDNLTLGDQRFDFTADPGWDGLNNRASVLDCWIHGRDDYGFGQTSFAGGQTGEIGGVIWRSDSQVAGLNARVSSYADQLGDLTTNDRLYAEGSIVVQHASTDGDLFVGWFNANSRISRFTSAAGKTAYTRPNNMLGATLGGPSEFGLRFTPYYVSRDPQQASLFSEYASGPSLAARGEVRRFWICYRPNADAAGDAVLTTGLSGVPSLGLPEARSDQVIPRARIEAGVSLNRFGIRNFQTGGHDMVVYLDDLRYTAASGDTGPAGRCGLDTTAPSGAIASPGNGAFVAGRSVRLLASAADDSGVGRVQFLVDGTSVGRPASTAPYTLRWNSATVRSGRHLLSAEVTDTSGNVTDIAPVELTVDNAPPTATLLLPASGRGAVRISARAHDGQALAGVRFLLDGRLLATHAQPPYEVVWNSRSVPNGWHRLRAVAVDRAGNAGASSLLGIKIQN